MQQEADFLLTSFYPCWFWAKYCQNFNFPKQHCGFPSRPFRLFRRFAGQIGQHWNPQRSANLNPGKCCFSSLQNFCAGSGPKKRKTLQNHHFPSSRRRNEFQNIRPDEGMNSSIFSISAKNMLCERLDWMLSLVWWNQKVTKFCSDRWVSSTPLLESNLGFIGWLQICRWLIVQHGLATDLKIAASLHYSENLDFRLAK